MVNSYLRAILTDNVRVHGFTLLRVTQDLVDLHGPKFAQLCRFVRLMDFVSEVSNACFHPSSSFPPSLFSVGVIPMRVHVCSF